MGLKIRWHCLLSFSTCTFEYKAARLDYPDRTVTPGFNFRSLANSHCNVCMYGTWCVCVCVCVYAWCCNPPATCRFARYWYENSVQYRDLIKAYGILFRVETVGSVSPSLLVTCLFTMMVPHSLHFEGLLGVTKGHLHQHGLRHSLHGTGEGHSLVAVVDHSALAIIGYLCAVCSLTLICSGNLCDRFLCLVLAA